MANAQHPNPSPNQEKYEEINDTVTESNLLQIRLFRSLQDTIENGVGNALEGLITRNKSLKESMIDMWGAAIRQASNYIVKLLIMKALGVLILK